MLSFFFLMLLPPPRSTLFPYTTLFRSFGILGVITEVTLRLTPLPKSSATLTASGTLSQTSQLAAELATSRLLPASVSILNPAAARSSSFPAEDALAAVWFEGFEESVSRHIRD